MQPPKIEAGGQLCAGTTLKDIYQIDAPLAKGGMGELYRGHTIETGDLVAINPDSPYADRLAFLAAECEEKQGQPERAVAAFRTFLMDYPGSPLVPDAKERLARLASGKPPGRSGPKKK